jgi:hypothetical protein
MSGRTKNKKLRIGDWVEVRSKNEILQTLDARGCVENMPFMPEMFQFCGRKFQVSKIAHKTCDYSTSYFHTRRLSGTVHLETRCDGDAHDGCQAGCLLFWKEVWLKRVDGNSAQAATQTDLIQNTKNGSENHRAKCTEESLQGLVKIQTAGEEAPTYFCQMTEVPRATTDLHWWDVRQYIDDYRSGNVPFNRLVTSLLYSAYYNLSQAGIGVGPAMRWLYDKVMPLLGFSRFPRTIGRIPVGSPTPVESLNLQPGELVRVKSHEQILDTVTTNNQNRGMSFDAELLPYCNGTYKVRSRVTRLIGEQSRKMLVMKTACIILESVVCQARYSSCRMLCPKAMFPYWREVWLERVESSSNLSENQRANAVTSHAKGD